MAERDPEMEIVTVFESDDLVAFELAKAVLDDAGVDYVVHEDAPARFGFSPILNPMRRILIPAFRSEEALELIAGAQRDVERCDDEEKDEDE